MVCGVSEMRANLDNMPPNINEDFLKGYSLGKKIAAQFKTEICEYASKHQSQKNNFMRGLLRKMQYELSKISNPALIDEEILKLASGERLPAQSKPPTNKRRIPDETINKALKLRALGMSYKEISERVGVCTATLYKYCSGEVDG